MYNLPPQTIRTRYSRFKSYLYKSIYHFKDFVRKQRYFAKHKRDFLLTRGTTSLLPNEIQTLLKRDVLIGSNFNTFLYFLLGNHMELPDIFSSNLLRILYLSHYPLPSKKDQSSLKKWAYTLNNIKWRINSGHKYSSLSNLDYRSISSKDAIVNLQRLFYTDNKNKYGPHAALYTDGSYRASPGMAVRSDYKQLSDYGDRYRKEYADELELRQRVRYDGTNSVGTPSQEMARLARKRNIQFNDAIRRAEKAKEDYRISAYEDSMDDAVEKSFAKADSLSKMKRIREDTKRSIEERKQRKQRKYSRYPWNPYLKNVKFAPYNRRDINTIILPSPSEQVRGLRVSKRKPTVRFDNPYSKRRKVVDHSKGKVAHDDVSFKTATMRGNVARRHANRIISQERFMEEKIARHQEQKELASTFSRLRKDPEYLKIWQKLKFNYRK